MRCVRKSMYIYIYMCVCMYICYNPFTRILNVPLSNIQDTSWETLHFGRHIPCWAWAGAGPKGVDCPD